MDLTPHQRTVLNYICEFQQKNNYSPSLADIAIAFGVSSKNAVAKVVNALVKKGHLEKDPKGRIKIVEPAETTVFESSESSLPTIPLFGPIAAGPVSEAEEQVVDRVNIDSFLVDKPTSSFLLRVRGDSMIGAGIHDGDLVIVERDAHPQINEYVVGLLDNEGYTLKTLKKNKGKYYLQAENPDYPDLYALEELRVVGVVRGVIRKY